MNRSESIKELATALCKAQGEMAGAKKDTANPFFKSKYADLASVREASFPALNRHGLSIAQFTVPSEKEEVVVETILMHESGEWVSGMTAIPVTKADAQGFGSALTYCRRYALAAAVGIAPEDDDGNAAAAAKPAKPEVVRGSAREATKDAYDDLSEKERADLQLVKDELYDIYQSKGIVDTTEYVEKLSTEHRLALWWLLKDDSEMRSSIKREQARRNDQTKRAA